jgi:hypothetical protein
MGKTVNKTMAAGTVLFNLFTGIGAVAASSCLALPLALSIAGFSGACLEPA